MDPFAQEMVRTILLVVGGALGVEIFRALKDGITGSMKRRRAEVDRIAAEKAASEAALEAAHRDRDEAERRLRVVTEHAHAVRVLAIQAGVSLPEFPTFREDPA